MRSLPIFLSTLLCLSLFAPAPAARAQSNGDDSAEEAELTPEQARAAARDAYAQGQALFREGKYVEAEAAFDRAYAIIPNPVVLLGVAHARREQGNIQGAVEALEKYLEERTDAPDAVEVQTEIDELKAMPATITIVSVPEGAAIVIDGEDIGEVTPAEIELPGGSHVVAFALEGYEPAEQRVEAPYGGRSEVSTELSAVAPEPEPTLEGEGDPLDQAPVDQLDDTSEDDAGPGTAVWVLSAVAAAGLVGGTVLGFLALTEESEFDDMPSEATADKGERFALFADVAFGVAAIAGISAIVVFLTADDDDEEEEATEEGASAVLYPAVSPTGAGLVGEVTF